MIQECEFTAALFYSNDLISQLHFSWIVKVGRTSLVACLQAYSQENTSPLNSISIDSAIPAPKPPELFPWATHQDY